MLRTIFAFTICASSLLAQGFDFGGLISGFIFDASGGAVRPFVGIPGGGYLGGATVSGLEAAWIAPGGQAALGVKEGRLFLIQGLKDPVPQWRQIESGQAPSTVAWSSDSSAVATYSRPTGALSVFQISDPEGTRLDWTDAALPDEPVTALALSRAGREVYFVRASGDAAGVHVASAGAAPRFIAAVNGEAALALVNGDRDLLVAPRLNSGVLLVHDAAGAAAGEPLAVELAPSSEIVGAACSPDARRLFLADRGTRGVLVYNLEAGAQESRLELEVDPEKMERISNGALYALSAPENGGPMYVLDAGANPGVYFVPAAGPAEEEE